MVGTASAVGVAGTTERARITTSEANNKIPQANTVPRWVSRWCGQTALCLGLPRGTQPLRDHTEPSNTSRTHTPALVPTPATPPHTHSPAPCDRPLCATPHRGASGTSGGWQHKSPHRMRTRMAQAPPHCGMGAAWQGVDEKGGGQTETSWTQLPTMHRTLGLGCVCVCVCAVGGGGG